jgi:hypothetical protein
LNKKRIFFNKNFKIQSSHKAIMWFSGTIRGCIAFGLAVTVETDNPYNRDVLHSGTLVLVFFTTIVLGALMPFAIKLFKNVLGDSEAIPSNNEYHEMNDVEEDSAKMEYMHPNFETEK